MDPRAERPDLIDFGAWERERVARGADAPARARGGDRPHALRARRAGAARSRCARSASELGSRASACASSSTRRSRKLRRALDATTCRRRRAGEAPVSGDRGSGRRETCPRRSCRGSSRTSTCTSRSARGSARTATSTRTPAATTRSTRYVDALLAEARARATGLEPDDDLRRRRHAHAPEPPRCSTATSTGCVATRRRRARLEEFTVEANPGTLTRGEGRARCATRGVTRVSLGVQSFDDAPPEDARAHPRRRRTRARSVGLLRDGGIARVSLDLILAMPGQTLAEQARRPRARGRARAPST